MAGVQSSKVEEALEPFYRVLKLANPVT